MKENKEDSNEQHNNDTEQIVSVGPLNLSAKEADYLLQELAARMEIEDGERADVYERIYWKLSAACNVERGNERKTEGSDHE